MQSKTEQTLKKTNASLEKELVAKNRELEIEAALEKVRSRSLAMHHSSELEQVAGSLFDRLAELGLSFDGALIFIFDKEKRNITLWIATNQLSAPVRIDLPYDKSIENNAIIKDLWKSIETGEHIINRSYFGEVKNDYFHYVTKYNESKIPESVRQLQIERENWTVHFAAEKNSMIGFDSWSGHITKEEDFKILIRFSKVFEQSYIRFLDLQKAEAQARESQIQLALERVRARTMAMQHSDELTEVAGLLFNQVKLLDLPVISCGFNIWQKEDKVCNAYMSDEAGFVQPPFKIPLTESPAFIHFVKSRQKGESFYSEEVSGEALAAHYKYMLTLPEFAEIANNFLKAGFTFPQFQVNNVANFTHGNLIFITNKTVPEAHEILKRFVKVFEQTYTRFLDLQKAEAQAREAQIELGLERVRARAMAMQKSDELKELIGTVFTELIKLDLALTRSVIWIFDAETNGTTWWMANSEDPENPMDCYIPYSQHPPYLAFLEQWKKRSIKFQYELKGENKKNWDDYLFSKTGLARLPGIVIEGMKAPEKVWLSASFNNFGAMNAASLDPLSDEHFDILLRFAKVFDLTYTRFNDLKQAEAQAREAQIELALERVRARTMTMQKSDELADVATLLFRQVNDLGIETWTTGFNIWTDDNNAYEDWLANPAGGFIEPYLIDTTEFSEFKALSNAKKSGTEFFILSQEGETLKETYKQLSRFATKNQFEKILEEGFQFPLKQFVHMVFGSKVSLMFITYEPVPEAHDIFKRFGKVFNQTYTRFLDLQKAEAQAREAQIEVALERVRGKAMSMHSSEDLAATIHVFYHEIESLSVTPRRCGVGLLNKETHIAELSSMNTTEQGESIEVIGKLNLAGHPVLAGIYENWLLQKEYHPVLRGNEIKEYYQLIRPQIAYPDYPTDMAQYGYFFFFNEGGVYAWTEKELSADELKIYRRFTSVLSLTYKRYKDLKDAEANAREAINRASLDRVRAETASMRTTSDLEKITPLIWNELTTLGVPFIRCGVFIMDEQQKLIHSFLSTPDGKAIAAFQLPYDSAGELSKVLVHWHKKEIYKDHWNEATFAEWTKSLVEQGAIASEEKYSTAHRPVNLNLHFLPFLQGMLYVGSETPLNDEEIHLVQSLANAFSTAYARYEDFNKLESAKAQIEKTLVDLKQTQAQLVQSEKMASLGELTAGIAHEIQNPLNFVNNFSELNTELIEEMKNELANGNNQQVMELADEIKENEQKINHHGKRADAIVKGMLQHSRSRTGVKEPTDINALADEYLRLSYHGLRAKDKSFNAEMKTDFDNSIGKINIIPQDIGRVLLNLFNNAFYAVNEQKSKNLISFAKEATPFQKVSPLYEPTVSVSTKKSDNHVIITVNDNGGGISQNIVDKVFQPFFTTKPTGSGTGLGLSLSYDIMKAHGGEIKVESKENEGSGFIIQLPIV